MIGLSQINGDIGGPANFLKCLISIEEVTDSSGAYTNFDQRCCQMNVGNMCCARVFTIRFDGKEFKRSNY